MDAFASSHSGIFAILRLVSVEHCAHRGCTTLLAVLLLLQVPVLVNNVEVSAQHAAIASQRLNHSTWSLRFLKLAATPSPLCIVPSLPFCRLILSLLFGVVPLLCCISFTPVFPQSC